MLPCLKKQKHREFYCHKRKVSFRRSWGMAHNHLFILFASFIFMFIMFAAFRTIIFYLLSHFHIISKLLVMMSLCYVINNI